jgi:hypothetical protein
LKKIDRYIKSLSERVDNLSNSNGHSSNENEIIIYDDDYYIAIGSEPPRFADYRAAGAKKKIGDTLTYEDVWDSITQEELDYYLKASLRTSSPEDRYQNRKEAWYFHESCWYMRHNNGYDGHGCNQFTGCVPECRYYSKFGRIEDEEIIREHYEGVERYRQRNAIVEPPST